MIAAHRARHHSCAVILWATTRRRVKREMGGADPRCHSLLCAANGVVAGAGTSRGCMRCCWAYLVMTTSSEKSSLIRRKLAWLLKYAATLRSACKFKDGGCAAFAHYPCLHVGGLRALVSGCCTAPGAHACVCPRARARACAWRVHCGSECDWARARVWKTEEFEWNANAVGGCSWRWLG